MNHLGMWYGDIHATPLPHPKLQACSILTSLVSFLKALSVAALSKGLFWFLPNIFGKYSGRSLPRQRLASVIVRGPPERILKIIVIKQLIQIVRSIKCVKYSPWLVKFYTENVIKTSDMSMYVGDTYVL